MSLPTPITPISGAAPSILTTPIRGAQSHLRDEEEQPELRPVQLRGFADAEATRQAIYDRTLKAAQNLPELQDGRHTLRISNVGFREPNYAQDFSPDKQKQAVLSQGTLTRALTGTLQLVDNETGKVLDERSQTLAAIPHMTSRGTFIHNGSEYVLRNQLRLRPGVYARQKDNGDLESFVNALPGRGFSHRYSFDPDKGVFYVHVQQAKIPLMPALRAMGATDDEIKAAWGKELFESNRQKNTPRDFNKLVDRVLKAGDKSDNPEENRERVAEAFTKVELDPEVSARTLGQPYDRLSPQAMLDATRKLVAVHRQEQDPDDRDDLANQQVVGPEDLLSERLANDMGYHRMNMFRKASWQKNLSPFAPGSLTKQVQAAMIGSGLGEAIQQVNTAEVLGRRMSVTRMGEGGIGSTHAVPAESRSNQASYLSFIDGALTPESDRVGVDLNLARGAMKGDDGRIYSQFRDARTGDTRYLSPQDVSKLTVAFPGQMDSPGKYAIATQNGKVRRLPKSAIDVEAPAFEESFSPLSNLVPFKSAAVPHRVSMGARMLTQSLPLPAGERPWVQAGTGKDAPGGRSYEEVYGEALGAIRAKKPGKVIKATDDLVVIRHDDGTESRHELFRGLPSNRKTSLTQSPTVAVGQAVGPGDAIAKSNYTTDTGEAALGVNALVGMMSFRGENFEDAIVISESFANRVAAKNSYQNKLELSKKHRPGKSSFIGLFPDKFDRKQLETLDKEGVVKLGQKVAYGDPLIVAVEAKDHARNRIHKKKARDFRDASVTWDHHSPGEVVDIVKGRNGKTINVVVDAINPTELGSKISNRYGGKGVISNIVPDAQMPRTAGGEVLEVLLNPQGVISRGNPSQVLEMGYGKIAKKKGEPLRVDDFALVSKGEDLRSLMEDALREEGMSLAEDVIDPETGRKIKGIAVGPQYITRLHHDPEDKAQGRAFGGYTQEGAPAKGGHPGGKSKRQGVMETSATLSYGAGEVVRDGIKLRGEQNDDYWLAYMQGYDPQPPKVPEMYRKFVDMMKASGINVVSDGPRENLMALTNQDVEDLSGGRRITQGGMVDFEKELRPITGGLFDEKLTGGHGGERWAAIDLPEPMLNPVFEEPTRKLLGLTKPAFEKIVRGEENLIDPSGQDRGVGMQAIGEALRNLDVDQELKKARLKFRTTRGANRDLHARRISYLKTLQRQERNPGDWMLNSVPVLPPKYRPVSIMQATGSPLVADANFLYRDLMENGDYYQQLQKATDDVGEERLGVYKSLRALTGLSDPDNTELKQRRVKGLLRTVFGGSAKSSYMQRKLLSSTTDLVGRGVIIPEPDYDVDSIGIPEDNAWEVYYPFIVRRLKRRGMPLAEAIRSVKDKTPQARDELVAEMDRRPVVMNRAPVHHKFGVLAMKPRLIKGSSIKLNPLVYKGLGADNDGDTIQYHVPAGEKAREEAIAKMMPSRNLIKTQDFKSSAPTLTQEYVMGLFDASRGPNKKQTPRRFATKEAVLAAVRRGEIDVDTPVQIG